MKTFRMLSVVALVMSAWITSYGQEEADVPGDHFSLEGALELFKKSSSPEAFEKMLNSPDSKVNNLDLNGDGYIDYVRVHDRYEGNVHAFILQAVVSETEMQDVAVIELEKLSNGKAVLQIIGDEDVYGIETIIEPTREVRTYAGTTTTNTVVNVWTWPSVRYIYGPHYSVWVSPWGWHARPVWWHTWRPIAYVHYYPVWHTYRPHYAACRTHRVVYAHRLYRPHRTTSVVVHRRHNDQITRYRTDYRNGRTRDVNRRSYATGDRNSRYLVKENQHRTETFDRNRKPFLQQEAVTSANPSSTRDQRVRTNIPRYPEMKREEVPNRTPLLTNRETRKETDAPTVNRNRPFTNPGVQQRPAVNERSANIQRNPTHQRRENTQNSRPVSIQNSRTTPQNVAPRSSYTMDKRGSGGTKVQRQPSGGPTRVPKSGEVKRGRQ